MKKNILLLAILGLFCVSESAIASGPQEQPKSGGKKLVKPKKAPKLRRRSGREGYGRAWY